MQEDERFHLDKRQIRRSFDAAADRYDAVAVLQREVAARLSGRLDLIRFEPRFLLDAGAGTGEATWALARRYRGARVLALDLATSMLMRARRRGTVFRRLPCVCADVEGLPLRDGSIDMIFSNLTLQWTQDLDRVFSGFQRVLRPGGLLMFSSFGPDTLSELRQSWAAVDDYSHVNTFIDMHDVGDALVRARFVDPVMDMEQFTLTYGSVTDLMRDLKCLGAHNVTQGRARGLTGTGRFREMTDRYEAFRAADGRLPATYEVVYGHAWAADLMPQAREGAVAKVPLSQLKRSKRRGHG